MSKPNLIKLTEATVQQLDDDSMGICLACHAVNDGCEPDARRYPCEACGEKRVYGVMELVLMGHVDVVDTLEEENIEY